MKMAYSNVSQLTPFVKYPYRWYFKSKKTFVIVSRYRENKVVVSISIPEIRFGTNMASVQNAITESIRNITM